MNIRRSIVIPAGKTVRVPGPFRSFGLVATLADAAFSFGDDAEGIVLAKGACLTFDPPVPFLVAASVTGGTVSFVSIDGVIESLGAV